MIDTILSIVNKFIPDNDEANRIALELQKEFTKRMELKSDIIRAEQANGSGKWRVRLMYLCMVMVAIHFILFTVVPYFIVLLSLNVYTMQPPDDTNLWQFLYIGVGGYITSRGAEKIAGRWKEK